MPSPASLHQLQNVIRKTRCSMLLSVILRIMACFGELMRLNEVYVHSLKCFDHVKKLYYLAGYEPICIYCTGKVQDVTNTDTHPQCVHCISKPKISEVTVTHN